MMNVAHVLCRTGLLVALLGASTLAADSPAPLDEARAGLAERTAEVGTANETMATLEKSLETAEGKLRGARYRMTEARQKRNTELQKTVREMEKNLLTEVTDLRDQIELQRTRNEAGEAAENAARKLVELREAESDGSGSIDKLRKRYQKAERKATELADQLP